MKFGIIDTSNLVHRIKHGVMRGYKPQSFMTPLDEDEYDPNSDSGSIKRGLILESVFKALKSSCDQFGIDHVVMCFDSRSWRKDIYPEYKKKNKIKTPKEIQDDELIRDIIESIMVFCRDYTNVTTLYGEGLEADDFIARWVQIHSDDYFHNIIVSRDSDFKQLVRNNVELFAPTDNVLYTGNGVFHRDGKNKPDDTIVKLYGVDWKVKTDSEQNTLQYDPDWELFYKCIRGDSNDNIKSAYPRVSKKKMKDAFYGDVQKWNNFINSTWGPEENKQSVRERYEFNKTLIDLTSQPDEIVEFMDQIIEEQLDKPRKRLIGAYFNKYCASNSLNNLLGQSVYYTKILSQKYPDLVE